MTSDEWVIEYAFDLDASSIRNIIKVYYDEIKHDYEILMNLKYLPKEFQDYLDFLGGDITQKRVKIVDLLKTRWEILQKEFPDIEKFPESPELQLLKILSKI